MDGPGVTTIGDLSNIPSPVPPSIQTSIMLYIYSSNFQLPKESTDWNKRLLSWHSLSHYYWPRDEHMTLDSSVILTLDNSVYTQYMLKGEAFIQYPGRSLLFLLDRIKKEVCCPLAAWQSYWDHEKHHMKTKPTPKNGTVARWKKTGSVGKKTLHC